MVHEEPKVRGVDFKNLLPLMDDRIYSEIEAAAIRGVSVKKLQAERWRRKGMPYVKDGRRVGYLGKDIRADIERNRVVPSAA